VFVAAAAVVFTRSRRSWLVADDRIIEALAFRRRPSHSGRLAAPTSAKDGNETAAKLGSDCLRAPGRERDPTFTSLDGRHVGSLGVALGHPNVASDAAAVSRLVSGCKRPTLPAERRADVRAS
jgi:hypothetical protein